MEVLVGIVRLVNYLSQTKTTSSTTLIHIAYWSFMFVQQWVSEWMSEWVSERASVQAHVSECVR